LLSQEKENFIENLDEYQNRKDYGYPVNGHDPVKPLASDGIDRPIRLLQILVEI